MPQQDVPADGPSDPQAGGPVNTSSAPPAKLFMEDLDRRRVPMSAGMIARWLMKAGLDSTAADRCADSVVEQLAGRALGTGTDPAPLVRRDQVFAEISSQLLAADLTTEERRVRVRRWVRTVRQPLVIAIGGSSGVGKSTVSSAVADRLGISVIISTDQVRAVVRSILEPSLLPGLHESSFSAAKMMRSNLTGNRLLFAYEEQARIVQHASFALVRRSLKEGQQLVLNGVHIVPGLIEIEEPMPLFTYVLTVADAAAHRGRFIQRFLEGDRKPTEYLNRMDAIRELDSYIVEQCHRHEVPVIISTTFDQTVLAVLDAVCADLEARFDTYPPGFRPAAVG
jgi:2-phosphoglycerate kinase